MFTLNSYISEINRFRAAVNSKPLQLKENSAQIRAILVDELTQNVKKSWHECRSHAESRDLLESINQLDDWINREWQQWEVAGKVGPEPGSDSWFKTNV